MGSPRVRRDRHARAHGVHARAARVALTLALALAAPAAAQSGVADEIDALLTEIEDGEERAPRLDELERLHAVLAARFDGGERLAWSETRALAWVAAELANPLPGDPERSLDALGALERAQRATKAYGPSDTRANAEYYLGLARRLRGRIALARADLELAVAELAETERYLPFLHLEIAECARLAGDWTAALAAISRGEEALERSRASRPEFENAALTARVPILRAFCMIDLGVPDHAFVDLARARELARLATDAATPRALALAEIAFAEATDDFAGALARVDAELARGGAMTPSERAQLDRSRAYALAGLSLSDPTRAGEAIAGYERALAQPALYEFLRPAAEMRLAELEIRRGGFARAAQLLESARVRLESADREGRGRHDAALLARFSTRLALDSGAPEETVRASLAELERAFERFLDDWASVPARRDGVGFLRYDERSAIVVELARAQIAVDRERGSERALATLLRAQALGNLSSALGGEPPTLAEVRRASCAPGRGVIAILPGTERSYAFGLTSDSCRAFELPPHEAWADLRRGWVARISVSPGLADDADARREDVERLGAALARVLLPRELRAWLEGLDEVSIGGLDLTGYLPFEALPYGDGALLGDRLAIAYVPSLVVAAKLARRDARAPGAGPALRVLAAPSTASSAHAEGAQRALTWRGDASPLEWHERRERALARAYGEGGFELALGDRATLEALAPRTTPGHIAVEVTAHGFYDAASWPPVGIALAPFDGHDGLVRCADVHERKAPPLVLLAVCGAARGPQREGDDGVGDFSGAFIKAGARCVVLSPVDLEQGATEALLDRFHLALAADGESPARAMLAARRALADSARTDPYYRSLVHVVGLGHVPLFPARADRDRRTAYVWLAGVAVVVSSVIAAARVRRSRRAC